MASKEYKDTIEQELQSLSKEQLIEFTWSCAVRAIPFLGFKGDFSFWEKSKRKKYIYDFFKALDLIFIASKAIRTAAIYNLTADKATNEISAAAVRAANLNQAMALDSSKIAVGASKDTIRAVIAVKNVSDSKRTFDKKKTIIKDTIEVVSNIIIAASEAMFYASEIDNSDSYNLRKIALTTAINIITIAEFNNLKFNILKDIVVDKKNTKSEIDPSEEYGGIWDKFLFALEIENCVYWGKLYKIIFKSEFRLEQKSLESRMRVPNEIKMQGAEEVANYLEELEKGSRRLNEARIIILGEKGVGKTCLARRLLDPEASMTEVNESTTGVDTSVWELKYEDINVRIWDFAGHVVTHAVHQFFLSERCLYIMVYDARTEARNRLEYWLDHMKNYGGDSKAIILVNKRDDHRPDISINNLIEKYPIIDYYEFSIKDDKKDLQSFRMNIANYIKDNTSWNKQEIPIDYDKVKDELENLFFKCKDGIGIEHITKSEFEKIADKHHVKEKDKLLKALHFLGVSLWYNEMDEFNTMVLNPEWISDGVYKIINWVHNSNRYSIKLEEFNYVFHNEAERYPEDKHRFLYNLIRHYELAYKTKQGEELIIPHLLGGDRPKILPDFPIGESLMLRYKAEQPLPINTISRFIVRHNKQIKKEHNQYLVWRYGVVLHDGKDGTALVREEDRTISVSVKGTDKTDYISFLRETLNDIFGSYKSMKPELQYRVERFGAQVIDEFVEENPLWLRDNRILTHHLRNRPYYDDLTNQEIPMLSTIKIFNINDSNIMIGGKNNQFINDSPIQFTFNFKDCSINLQGNLNELAGQLTKTGHKEEAKELQEAAETLELAEELKDEKELKKKGVLNSVKRFLDDLENKDSKLHNTVKGIKRGVSIAQDIAKGYNDIAQWAGLPQVPKPFLKNE